MNTEGGEIGVGVGQSLLCIGVRYQCCDNVCHKEVTPRNA